MDRKITKKEQRSRQYRKLALWVGIAGVILAGGIIINKCTEPIADSAALKWVTADRGDIEATISGTGNVVPAFEEVINSPVGSRVVEIYHRPGDEVEAGTPLLRLDLEAQQTAYDNEYDKLQMLRLQLNQLRANNRTRLSDLKKQIEIAAMKLKRSKAELVNERYLDSIGSGTTDRVREVELNCSSIRLELEQLQQQLANETEVKQADEQLKMLEIEVKEKELSQQLRTLGEAEIRAPRHATVTSIVDRLGSTVSAGQQVASVADLGHYRVEARMAENYASELKPGSTVWLKVNRIDLEGFLSAVTPTAVNGFVTATVSILNDSATVLRPGVKADVKVVNGLHTDAIRLPNRGFYTGPGLYNLYVRRPGEDYMELRDIRLGAAGYDYVEVISGVAPGEEVVISDTQKFENQSKIKIK